MCNFISLTRAVLNENSSKKTANEFVILPHTNSIPCCTALLLHWPMHIAPYFSPPHSRTLFRSVRKNLKRLIKLKRVRRL